MTPFPNSASPSMASQSPYSCPRAMSPFSIAASRAEMNFSMAEKFSSKKEISPYISYSVQGTIVIASHHIASVARFSSAKQSGATCGILPSAV